MPCPDSLPAIAGALAAAIAQGRSEDDIALLAALFTQLGDGLALILAARACGSSQPPAGPQAGGG